MLALLGCTGMVVLCQIALFAPASLDSTRTVGFCHQGWIVLTRLDFGCNIG